MGVVDGVAAAFQRHAAHIGAPRPRQRGDPLGRTGQRADRGVEALDIGLEQLGRVALGVDADEHDVEPARIGAEFLQDRRDLQELGPADVRAVGESRRTGASAPAQDRLGLRTAVLIDELERRAERGGAGVAARPDGVVMVATTAKKATPATRIAADRISERRAIGDNRRPQMQVRRPVRTASGRWQHPRGARARGSDREGPRPRRSRAPPRRRSRSDVSSLRRRPVP